MFVISQSRKYTYSLNYAFALSILITGLAGTFWIYYTSSCSQELTAGVNWHTLALIASISLKSAVKSVVGESFMVPFCLYVRVQRAHVGTSYA